MLFSFLVVLHIFICAMLVISILMQSSKGGGLAGTFGGTQATALLGGRQAADTLTKATVVLSLIFALSSILLNVIPRGDITESVIEQQLEEGNAPALPQ